MGQLVRKCIQVMLEHTYTLFSIHVCTRFTPSFNYYCFQVATLRLLLSPLPTVDLADCAFLLRAPGQDARFASMSQPLLQEHSRFLLEVVDGVGDTPLAAALKAQPFRESHLGKDSADSSAAAQHTALRSSSRCGASLYDIDPRSILGLPPSSAQSGAGGRTATGASTNKLNSLASTKSMLSSSSSSIRLESTRSVKTLARSALQSSTGSSVALDFGTGGLACALTLLSAGSRPATLNDHGCSPLHVAAAAPEHVAALRALLDVNGGADVNAQVSSTGPLFHFLMVHFKGVKFLFFRCSDVATIPYWNENALFIFLSERLLSF